MKWLKLKENLRPVVHLDTAKIARKFLIKSVLNFILKDFLSGTLTKTGKVTLFDIIMNYLLKNLVEKRRKLLILQKKY